MSLKFILTVPIAPNPTPKHGRVMARRIVAHFNARCGETRLRQPASCAAKSKRRRLGHSIEAQHQFLQAGHYEPLLDAKELVADSANDLANNQLRMARCRLW